MKQLMNQFLSKQRNQKVRIHCVGDAMIDEYFKVYVNRISPEFPMPIMHSEKEESVKKPGGVANVAYQFRHFNVDTKLICFSDTEATVVFRDHNLSYSPCTTVAASIPRKKRFLDNGTQIKRWDIEKENNGIEGIIDARKDTLEFTDNYETPDVAILSDYNKGFFEPKGTDDESNQSWLKRYKDCITVVDPKHGSVHKWKGCTVFKPNAKEAEEITGLKDPKLQCSYLEKTLGCKAVIITQGGNGVIGRFEGKEFEYIPENCCSLPESVIGAGDCFSAFLAHALALGFNPEDSAKIAFEAGAQYVQNQMNRPIVPAELSLDGFVSAEDLASRDFKLVFTNGCFDLLHRGHLQTLNFAKSKGDKLVVALNSDDSVRRLKGEDRPVKMEVERVAVMAALEMVDFVILFEDDTPYDVIKTCKPDVLVKGSDYELDNIVGSDIVKEVYRSPLAEGLSTTGILSRGIGITGT